MRDGLVSKHLFDRVVKLSKTHDQVREQLERMADLEPYLYSRLFQDIANLKDELELSTIPSYVIEIIDYRVGRMLARTYTAITIATTELWEEVEQMERALLKPGKSTDSEEGKQDPDDEPPSRNTPTDDSWL